MIQRMIPALLLALLLTGCADMPDNNVDPATVTELASCPPSPNCVCSTDTGRSHYIDPLAVSGKLDVAWQTLRDILSADGSISIVAAGGHYIRAEAKTRFLRFTDDVEFLLNREAGVIEMRSASRVGYSDLGKNRSRLEGIRSVMRDAGAIDD